MSSSPSSTLSSSVNIAHPSQPLVESVPLLALPASCRQDRMALLERLKTLSFKRGNFVLASGKRSSFYLDARTTAMDSEGARLMGRLLYASLGDQPVHAVGGMAVGAVPLVSSVLVAAASAGQSLQGFFVRKEAKGHGARKQVEGHLAPWMTVVLLEDVVTTGGSTRLAIEAIRAAAPGVRIAGVLSVVNRSMLNPFEDLGIAYHALFSITEFLV
jgi:orotate phosphoribosyltransferase